jgi:hypothetical protein
LILAQFETKEDSHVGFFHPFPWNTCGGLVKVDGDGHMEIAPFVVKERLKLLNIGSSNAFMFFRFKGPLDGC